MSKNKKKNRDPQKESEEAVSKLAESLIQMFHERDPENLEVVEQYVYGLLAKIHSNDGEFCKRMVRGYQVLTRNGIQHRDKDKE